MTSRVQFVELDWAGRRLRIEHQWIQPDHVAADGPLMVFLHEGLGSVAMWKDFPQRLCEAVGIRGLVYSRPGYGRSTPRAEDETWDVDFMHRQAYEVLPALFDALRIDARRTPLWLFGHSDGGSIALLHAARHPESIAGLVVLAPHLFVEDVTVTSIAQARDAYMNTELRQRLARYHDDVDSAFWGWNRIWLHPPFRDWNIERDIVGIRCSVLAVQGLDDEYGSMEQIRAIPRHVPQTRLLELRDCGHSPHRDQPQAVMEAVARFMHKST